MNKQKIIKELKLYSDTPELDVHFFLQDYPEPTQEQIDNFLLRRQKGEPVAKILGHCGFWDLDFLVSKDTLDPRPDSETMIEAVLDAVPNRQENLNILDVGTGCGCLLLTLLSLYPNAYGVGIDKSVNALKIANQNAIRLQMKNVSFQKRDFMRPNWIHSLGMYDVIVSNPPYIPSWEIQKLNQSVKGFDPLLALDGGMDGLDAYRALAGSVSSLLSSNGRVFFEIGQGQENAVQEIMKQFGFKLLKQYKDLGKITRILMFQRN